MFENERGKTSKRLFIALWEMVGRQRKMVPQAGVLMIEKTEISNKVVSTFLFNHGTVPKDQPAARI